MLAPSPSAAVEPGRRPTLSVIVAAYQAAATIGEALESVFAQTVLPEEVVVCDDGSTDALDAALEPYRERVHLIQKENGGEASAKNAAARAASGEFVVILDADDLFLPKRLEVIGEMAAARPDLDIFTTDAVLEVDGQPVRRCYTSSFPFPVQDQRTEILRRNFVFGLAAVRREQLLVDGGFDESIRFTTDWERWIRMILAGSRVAVWTEPLARYRLLRGSLSSQRSRMLAGRLATLEKSARHRALDAADHAVLHQTILWHRRELAITRAREALRDASGDARRRSLEVARTRGVGLRTRLKAVASAAAPRVAGRRLAARPHETTAGIMLRPDS
jgi:glycosyltransferase involved in cell wall biosynthesis